MPPLERCRRCGAPTTFEPISGNGTIYTFIVQRQPAVVGYFDQVPYAVALVDIDEQPGVRLPGRVVDIDPDDVTIGMRVSARIVDLPGGNYRIPVFDRLVPQAASGSLVVIHRSASAGSMRCSPISSSMARNRASSFDGTIPKRSGFDAATATHVLHAARCTALK